MESFNLIYYGAEGSDTTDYASAVRFQVSIKLKISQSKQQVTITRNAIFKLIDKFSTVSNPEPEPASLHCFLIDNGGARIRDYYYYEHNNSANPACPRDVVIPSAITSTYNSSMSSKNLTSVTFLDEGQSISIGTHTFRGNNLKSLTIPHSVSSIGTESFWGSQISSPTALDRPVPIEIGTGAFKSNNFSSVTIPPSVNRMAADTFAGNSSLAHAFVSNSTTIKSTSFPSWTRVTRY